MPRTLVLAGGAVLAAIIIGAAVSFATADSGPGQFQSERQDSLIAERGEPVAWFVADGPLAPGGASHRTETWFLRDGAGGIAYAWVDGVLIGEPSAVEAPPAWAPERRLGPQALHQGLSRDDVAEITGEDGELVSGFESAFPGSTAYHYAKARILVTYLGDRFFTAQTYPTGPPP